MTAKMSYPLHIHLKVLNFLLDLLCGYTLMLNKEFVGTVLKYLYVTVWVTKGFSLAVKVFDIITSQNYTKQLWNLTFMNNVYIFQHTLSFKLEMNKKSKRRLKLS